MFEVEGPKANAAVCRIFLVGVTENKPTIVRRQSNFGNREHPIAEQYGMSVINNIIGNISQPKTVVSAK
jgi:hypothetical protein